MAVFHIDDLEKVDSRLMEQYAVLAADGLFMIEHWPHGSCSRRIHKLPSEDDDHYMGERFHPNFPLIPMRIIMQSAAFFRAVYRKHASEAILQLFHNTKTKQYELWAPVQEVSPGRAEYSIEDSPDEEVQRLFGNPDIQLYGTIHSHASMSAGHSATDQTDEENCDGIHITLGNFSYNDGQRISYSFSFVYRGKRLILNPEDIVERWNDPFGSFPDEWLEKVTKKVHQTTTYYGGYKKEAASGKKPEPENSSPSSSAASSVTSLLDDECEYKHLWFECERPTSHSRSKRCRMHNISTYMKKSLKRPTVAIVDHCECGVSKFREVFDLCTSTGKHSIIHSDSFQVALLQLLAQAELAPAFFSSLGRALCVPILRGLECIAGKQIPLNQKTLLANHFMSRMLEAIKDEYTLYDLKLKSTSV